jgi:hypothetical protein
MSVTNGWGQWENTIDWGKGKTTATNDWGKIYDSSASGDTTLASASTPFTNTYSVNLDGFNDYVTMGDVLDTSNTGASALSISAWYKTSDSGTQIIASKWSNSSPYEGYGLYLTSVSKMTFYIGSFSGNAYILKRSNQTNSFTDGNWHHVVATYDGSRAASGVKIYVDGSEITLNTVKDVAPSGVDNVEEFLIGMRGKASSYALPFDGNIDEVAYFTSELSASDVTTIYNSGVPNDISSLSPTGWWRMGDNDSGTGTTVTDQGSGSNNGTLTNSPTFQTNVPT